MKAYKVFNPDWTCKGFQYEIGKRYEMPEHELAYCSRGFHACKKASGCFSYYTFDPRNKVALVELGGTILGADQDKQCSNIITIIEEIKWDDLLNMVNTGSGNSGHSNSGDWNSGYCNSGDSNSGHNNSGHNNSGNWNSGDSNSGHNNSGNWNSGDSNSGNWNSGDRNSGYFCTNNPPIRIFNKITDSPIEKIRFPEFLSFDLTRWVSYDTATESEREEYRKEIEVCGGFIKTLDYKEAFQLAYQNASKEDRDLLRKLPNFDADIFYEISGIRVDQDSPPTA